MITIYKSGKQFLQDNKFILVKYPFETVFFEVNAKSIAQTNANDFLIKLDEGDKFLIAVHNSHYPMVLFGDNRLCAEFARQAFNLKLTFDKVIGALDTCEAFLPEYDKLAKCNHTVNHAMDIMRCDRVLTDNIDNVEIPNENDINELAELTFYFAQEALGDVLQIEEIKKGIGNRLSDFCVIRRDGRIASYASVKRETESLACIADVYTLPQYRCQGLSCKIVTYLTKRIVNSGKLAYLFVDKTNPISNHLYQKIGYTYAVPQYEIKLNR